VKRETRTVLLVLAALGLVGCLVAGGAMAVFAFAVEGLGPSEAWSEDAVPERELPTVFGVRLPMKPVRYTSRQLGFQDAFFEVMVELPPGSAAAFLAANGLTRGVGAPLKPEVGEVLDTLAPGHPVMTASELALPEATLPDGGAWLLHRSAELLEGPGGEVWVHLEAFES
jgi:hypothetical protein